MSIAELAPVIRSMPHIQKLQLLQLLVSEICQEENLVSLDPTVTYPVWTPYNIPDETASKLATLLESQEDYSAN